MTYRASHPALGSEEPALRNRKSFIRLGLMIAVAGVLAVSTPPALVVATFSSLLMISALIASIFALFSGEAVSAPHFTRWDEAAALLALSLLAGFFVDPAAVQDAVMRAQGDL